MVIAVGAGAAGVNGELNPMRTHPHGSSPGAARGIIVKFRAAGGPSQRAKLRLAQDRVSSLMARTGLKLRAARSITELMHVIRVETEVAAEAAASTLERLRADPEVEYAQVDQRRYPHATTPNDPMLPEQWYLQPSSATTPATCGTSRR